MSSYSSPPEDIGGSIGIPQLIFCAIVVALVYRYVVNSNQGDTSINNGRRPRANNPAITADAIEALRAMFPQVSVAAIRWDLERNGGNVDATTEKILAEGSLPERASQCTGRFDDLLRAKQNIK
ncbi:hypothetical protein ABW20_dc0107228 [Dactylellina cionopaga]|nr:hypothetical protein ABW20_dc0107228 [Dactylellina cionopaga]